MTKPADRADVSAEELERLFFHWPSVIGRASSEWERGFALSIMRRRNWRNWRPTPAQLGVMRKLVADLFIDPQSSDGQIQMVED